MELDLDKNILMDEIRSIYTEALNVQ